MMTFTVPSWSKYSPEWKRLVENLSIALDNAPLEKDIDYKPIIFALDEILDELKSGESLGDWRNDILPLFKKIYIYPNWHLKQSVTFAYPSVFADSGPLKVPLDLWEGAGILHTLLQLIADDKREIRDASSQALGALSKTMGNDIFSYVMPTFLNATKTEVALDRSDDYQTVENFPIPDAWHLLEGLMTAIGYIVRNCEGISSENFFICFNILQIHASHSKYPAFSGYIRRQALKAFSRIVGSSHSTKLLHEKYCSLTEKNACKDAPSYLTKLNSIAFERLEDSEIDVRKAAAELQHFVCKQQLLDSEAAIHLNVVAILSGLQKAASWEARHGLCLALANYCAHTGMVSHFQSVEEIFDAMSEQIKHTHDLTDKLGVAATANAVAANAMTALFITHVSLKMKEHENSDPTGFVVEQMSEKMNLSGVSTLGEQEKNLASLFSLKIEPQLVTLLNSQEALLLDAGGTCLHTLLKTCRSYVEPSLDKVMCLVYKNMFHASMPIRDGAIKNWNLSLVHRDQKLFLSQITPDLIQVLVGHASSKDTDVRETVFKALEDIFRQPGGLPPSCLSETFVDDILQVLINGSKDTRGGNNSEYPRSAATKALAEFLTACKKIFCTHTQLKTLFSNQLLPLASELLGSESCDSVQTAALQIVCGIVTSGIYESYVERFSAPAISDSANEDHLMSADQYFDRFSRLFPLYSMLTPLMVLSHCSVDALKFEAIKSLTIVFGNFESFLKVHGVSIVHFFLEQVEKYPLFSLDPEINDDDEMPEAFARVLAYLATLRQSLLHSFQQAPQSVVCELYLKLLSITAAGLMHSENLESISIRSNCIAFLIVLLQYPKASEFLDSASMEMLQNICRFSLHLLYNRIGNFDIDSCLEEDKSDFSKWIRRQSNLKEEPEEDDSASSHSDDSEDSEDIDEEEWKSTLFLSQFASVNFLLSVVLPLLSSATQDPLFVQDVLTCLEEYFIKYIALFCTEGTSESGHHLCHVVHVMEFYRKNGAQPEMVAFVEKLLQKCEAVHQPSLIDSALDLSECLSADHWEMNTFGENMSLVKGIRNFSTTSKLTVNGDQNLLTLQLLKFVAKFPEFSDLDEAAVRYWKGQLLYSAISLMNQFDGDSVADIFAALAACIQVVDEEDVEEDDQYFFLFHDTHSVQSELHTEKPHTFSHPISCCNHEPPSQLVGGYRSIGIVPLGHLSPLFIQKLCCHLFLGVFNTISDSEKHSVASSLLVRFGMLKSEFKVEILSNKIGGLMILSDLAHSSSVYVDTLRIIMIPFFVKYISFIKHKCENGIPEEYRWYPRVLYSLCRYGNELVLRGEWLDALLALAKQKWLRNRSGRAAVALAGACVAILMAMPDSTHHKQDFLQYVSDLFVEEDIGEARWPLLYIYQQLTSIYDAKRYSNCGGGGGGSHLPASPSPILLPTPNPLMTVKDNATFDEAQSQ